MDNKRAIITCAFGDRRENIERLVKNIRSYVDYPIIIVTDRGSLLKLPIFCTINQPEFNIRIKIVERFWPNHPRSGQRNGDYWQMKATLDSEYDQILYLDDDMYIINKDFIQGFDLAKKFGVCLPLNPRSFVGVDANIGADVPNNIKVSIPLATAYNCGTMFVDKRYIYEAKEFIGYCEHILLTKPMRGPMAVWETVDTLDINPYILPPQFCVCHEDIGIHNPIILHAGHDKVREYYKIGTLSNLNGNETEILKDIDGQW